MSDSYFKGRKLPSKKTTNGRANPVVEEVDIELELDWEQPKSEKQSPRSRSLRQEVIYLLDHDDDDANKPSTSKRRSSENDAPQFVVPKKTKKKRQAKKTIIDLSDSDDEPIIPRSRSGRRVRTTQPEPEFASLSSDHENDVNTVVLDSDPEEKMNQLGISGKLPEKVKVGLRVQYKGTVKRIHVPKEDTFRSIISSVKEAFGLKKEDLICLERDGEKLKPDSSPAALESQNFKFITDVLFVEFVSAEDLSTTISTQDKDAENEDCPVGYLPVCLRERLQLSHAECHKCITQCDSCSTSNILIDAAANKRRKDTEFKARVKEDTPLKDFIDSVKNRIFTERKVSTTDLPSLSIKFVFDGEEIGVTHTPEDFDMEADSLIDVVLVDKRMCSYRICCCQEVLQTKRTKGRKRR